MRGRCSCLPTRYYYYTIFDTLCQGKNLGAAFPPRLKRRGFHAEEIDEGHKAEFELPTSVYRLNPDTGKATVVTSALERPNGICFSPKYDKLYIADTGTPKHIVVFDVVDGERLGKKQVFYKTAPGNADGLRCDIDGNVWAGAGWVGEGYDGVHIFDPDGTLIGKIHLPEICSNICFGGVKRNRLFMTASQSLYSVYVEAQGAPLF